jgi:SAM-dependent methyltransferase
MSRDPSALRIPRKAPPFILFQRVNLQGVGQAINRNALGVMLYRIYEKSALLKICYRFYTWKLEPIFRSDAIARSYSLDMTGEMETLKPVLPAAATTIVDIGCGIGGIDVLLYRHYVGKGKAPDLYLIDRNEVSPKIVLGYHDRASSYNSLELTAETMRMNEIPADRVHTVVADGFYAADIPPVDLVLSLYAWGFHFPVQTYIERVYAILRPGGRLILDLRKDTEGFDVVRRYFGGYTVIAEDVRHQRIAATKP